MATFLTICQDVARESGTFPQIGVPLTTVGQTGRLARLVYWVRDAYNLIQRQHQSWLWLQADFSGSTAASTQVYTASALGIASRFGAWLYEGEDGENEFSLYLPADGQATENVLEFLPWEEFRRKAMIGSNATLTGKPTVFTVTPANAISLYPIPDAAYTLRGRYLKSAQTLSADGDEPEMPAHFHDLIKWQALILLGLFDEAGQQVPMWSQYLANGMTQLEIQQLQRIRKAGPFA